MNNKSNRYRIVICIIIVILCFVWIYLTTLLTKYDSNNSMSTVDTEMYYTEVVSEDIVENTEQTDNMLRVPVEGTYKDSVDDPLEYTDCIYDD